MGNDYITKVVFPSKHQRINIMKDTVKGFRSRVMEVFTKVKGVVWPFGKKVIVSSEAANELRDKIIDILSRAHIQLAPEFISVPEEEKANDPYKRAVDGLVRSTAGYFRVAEDPATGNKLLLFSGSAQRLIGEVAADGAVRLKRDPKTGEVEDNVYLVSSRVGDIGGSVLRQDMMAFEEEFKNANLFHLNLTMEDITPPSTDENPNPNKVYRLANSRAAIGLFENNEGKWTMRLYSDARGSKDETNTFVAIDETIPTGFFGNKVFSLGNEYPREFENFDEALQAAKRYWNRSSVRLWKGEPFLSLPVEPKGRVAKWYYNTKVKLKQKLISYWDNKSYNRSVGVTAVVAAVSTVPAVFGGVAGMVGAFAAVTTALATKGFEDGISWMIDKLRESSDTSRIARLQTSYEKEFSSNYVDGPDARICRKIKPEVLESLRLLNYTESGMNYDNGKTYKTHRRDWEAYSLLSMPYRMFGNIKVLMDDNTIMTTYPNGVKSLTKAVKDSRTKARRVTNIITYDEDSAVSGSAPLHQGVKKILEDNKVLEVRYSPETGLEINPLNVDTAAMEKDLRQGDALYNTLLSIFNNESVDRPKIKALYDSFSYSARKLVAEQSEATEKKADLPKDIAPARVAEVAPKPKTTP